MYCYYHLIINACECKNLLASHALLTLKYVQVKSPWFRSVDFDATRICPLNSMPRLYLEFLEWFSIIDEKFIQGTPLLSCCPNKKCQFKHMWCFCLFLSAFILLASVCWEVLISNKLCQSFWLFWPSWRSWQPLPWQTPRYFQTYFEIDICWIQWKK